MAMRGHGALAFADLKPGHAAFDLGCGNAVVAAWLAERFGMTVKAVERFEPVADLARETARGVKGPGGVEVVVSAAAPFLAQAGRCRLLVAIGTVNLLADAREPAEVFAALRGSIEPGGYLLWGDPFWRREPSARLKAMFVNERYQTHPAYVEAGEAAGLTPLAAMVSSGQDWDDYSWRMIASVEDWAAENPGDPDVPAFRAQIGAMRKIYLEEARETLGFGLYLFRN
jgi:SAM-dependent methyltransferase